MRVWPPREFDPRKLGRTVVKSAEYMEIHTVWPFNFFPDTIKLDDQKLTIIKRGFLTKKTITIKLVDLFNVELLEAPFFCTVRVIGKYVTGGHEDVPYVSKPDANRLHQRAMELLVNKNNPDESGGQ